MRRILLGLFVACSVTTVVANTQHARRKTNIEFEGNKVFSSEQLAGQVDNCLSNLTPQQFEHTTNEIDYCLAKLQQFLGSKGYLRATVRRSSREVAGVVPTVVTIEEGDLYRLGKVEIKGASLFAPQQLLALLNLKSGDVAAADTILQWLEGRVKNSYANHGYIQFFYSVNPVYGSAIGGNGIVDLKVEIDEGQPFTIRSIRFDTNGKPEDDLQKELLVRVGEVFNKDLFEQSLKQINQTGRFETIDADKDVNYRWDGSKPLVDLTIHLKKKS